MHGRRLPRWLRGALAGGGLALWCVVLWAAHAPWRGLGGLVDERLRWLADVVLWGGLLAGATAAELLSGLAPPRAAAFERRCVLYPPTLAAAVLLVLAELRGATDVTGVVLIAWLAFAAGATVTWMCPAPLPDEDPDRNGDRSDPER